MTDDDAWEAHCAAGEGPPYICNDCGAAFDPTDDGGIDEHRLGHYEEWLRSHCPIPPPPWGPRVFVIPDKDPEVPF